MEIIPSVLEKSPSDLLTQIEKLLPYFKSFQIDIADGIFVPNKTVLIEEISEHLTYNMKHVTFDFHLMVKEYEREVVKLIKLLKFIKINTVFIHFSLLPNIKHLTTDYPFTFAPVLNPEDPVEELDKLYQLKIVSAIQIMSVNPGFQGSEFLPETLKKIEQLRLKNYRNKIYLDGGINADSLKTISRQKFLPDVLCPGSFLTQAPDIAENVRILNSFLKL